MNCSTCEMVTITIWIYHLVFSLNYITAKRKHYFDSDTFEIVYIWWNDFYRAFSLFELHALWVPSVATWTLSQSRFGTRQQAWISNFFFLTSSVCFINILHIVFIALWHSHLTLTFSHNRRKRIFLPNYYCFPWNQLTSINMFCFTSKAQEERNRIFTVQIWKWFSYFSVCVSPLIVISRRKPNRTQFNWIFLSTKSAMRETLLRNILFHFPLLHLTFVYASNICAYLDWI